MSDKKRAQYGIVCAMCEKQLSRFDPLTDTHIPSAEELYTVGRVAIPNFGWFCSQECASRYEIEHEVKFQRDQHGNVNYCP